jgi:hypothetical protein
VPESDAETPIADVTDNVFDAERSGDFYGFVGRAIVDDQDLNFINAWYFARYRP